MLRGKTPEQIANIIDGLRKNLSAEERSEIGDRCGWVYFLGPKNGKVIKIGWARNPAKRIAELQVSHHQELRFVGVIPGTKTLEAAYHILFSHAREKGEWFVRSAITNELTYYLCEFGLFPNYARQSRNSPGRKIDLPFSVRKTKELR